MKPIAKLAVLTPAFVLMFLLDVPPEMPAPYIQLVPEAHAIFGVRRRAFVVGASVGAASASSAAASEQAAAAQQQAMAAQQQAAAAPPPRASGQPLPVGTVVHALPGGCTSTPVGGVEYYYCGGNFYRAMFQGNSLVYVTAQPK